LVLKLMLQLGPASKHEATNTTAPTVRAALVPTLPSGAIAEA